MNTALYYPYIHPRKIEDLMASLLLWDSIRRIVPPSIAEGNGTKADSDHLKLLADEGLLVSTSPAPYRENAEKRLLALINSIGRANPNEASFESYHLEKMAYSLSEELQRLGIGRKSGDWIHLPENVGGFYMYCLASEMAKRMATPLITDDDGDGVGQALLFSPGGTGADTPGPQDITALLVSLDIRLPSPDELKRVTLSKFLKFLKRTASERKNFRETVLKTANAVRSIPDKSAVEDYLRMERQHIERSQADLMQALEEIHVSNTSSICRVTLPAALGIAAWITPTPLTVGAAVLSIGIGLVECFATTRGKARQASASSPYHYLLSAKQLKQNQR